MENSQVFTKTFTSFSELPEELRRVIWKLSAEDPEVVTLSSAHRILTPCGKVIVPAIRKQPAALHTSGESRDETETCYNKSFGVQLGSPVWFNNKIDTLYLANEKAMRMFYLRTPKRAFKAQPRETVRFLAITPGYEGSNPQFVSPTMCAYLIYDFLPTLEEVVVVESETVPNAKQLCADIIISLKDVVNRAREEAQDALKRELENEMEGVAAENDVLAIPIIALPRLPAIFELSLGEFQIHAKLRSSN